MDIEKLFNDDSKYLQGTENWLIRAYFYCSNGLMVLNEFRNLFLGVVAIYLTLKITNLYLIAGIIVTSIIVLTLVGYYMVHKVAKTKEWLGIRFGSHFGMKTFNYTEESYKLLENINRILVDEEKRIREENK